MIRFTILLLSIYLAGCANFGSGPGIQPVKSVDRAVSVSCVEEMPEPPKLHTDAELKAMSDYEATLTLLRERILLEIWSAKLEALLEACK